MEAGPIADFENACEHAVDVQRELLNEILLKNSSCEYLHRYGAPLDLKSFKSQVPVVSYDDIQQDIQRVADGSTHPILCIDPIVQFAQSSGTSSGRHKIIPQTLGSLYRVQTRILYANFAYTSRYFPLESTEPVAMSFLYCAEQQKTQSGLPIGPVGSNYYRTEAFKRSSRQQTSPYELIVAGADWKQTTYCHLLCGLLQRHKVEIISTLFAYTMCEAMRLLQREWRNLCKDIATGTLNTNLITDERLRSIMSEVLQRELQNQNSEELAERISGICSAMESWQGIIPLLWPRVKYVHAVVTGAMLPYVTTLKKYAGSDLPLVGAGYASSEGMVMGLNINPAAPPENVVFTLVPYTVFFEFIPVDGDEESIVDFEGLQVGKQYELVITTSQGLYRHKFEDVFKVTGFFKKAPQLAFSYRKNAVLSVNTEKIDEQELQKAVLKSFADVNIEVADFTSYADFETEERPHYVIFCELGDTDEHQLLSDCCERLEKSFDNRRYLTGRVNNTIGPLELVLVKHGTFEKLMEMAVRSGASPGQYKTPRCVTSPRMLKVLKEHQVGSFKSSFSNLSSLRLTKSFLHCIKF